MGILDQIVALQSKSVPFSSELGGLFGNDAPAVGGLFSSSPDELSGLSREEKNVIDFHRNNLSQGRYLRQPNGDLTTFMGSVVNINGKETLIPTYWNGAVLDPEAAASMADKSGISFPSYKSASEALARERVLHKIMERDVAKFENRNASR